MPAMDEQVVVSIRVILVLVILILVVLLLMLLSRSFWQSAVAAVTMVYCKCILFSYVVVPSQLQVLLFSSLLQMHPCAAMWLCPANYKFYYFFLCCKCINVQLCGYVLPTASSIIFFSMLSDSCFPQFQRRLHIVCS
jgi:hypothetical protein